MAAKEIISAALQIFTAETRARAERINKESRKERMEREPERDAWERRRLVGWFWHRHRGPWEITEEDEDASAQNALRN